MDSFIWNRRDFLRSTSLLIGARAIHAQEVQTLPVAYTAAPRGLQRNLLAKQCPPATVQKSLLSIEHYKPFPKLGDHEWQTLSPSTRAAFAKAGESALTRSFQQLPATLFLEYARNGNRSHYEALRSAMLATLLDLTYAECIEGKGRFLDSIANGLWSICEQSFWGVPAHLYIQKHGLGLPDPKDPIVDLFAADTSAELATVLYLLGPALDTVSPIVRERVFAECERRIFEPLLSQNLMWMGLPGGKRRDDLPWDATPAGKVQPVNNWDAWICSNWLTTELFVDTNADRRLRSVQKIMQCLDQFINTYPNDGGCEEGPSYYNRAAISMYDTLQLLSSSTSGRINLWHDPLLRRMGEYLLKARIAGDQYLDIGDAHTEIHFNRDSLFQFGKLVDSPSMVSLARADLEKDYVPRALAAIFNEPHLRAEMATNSPLLKDVWLPDTGLMAARMKADDASGLYVACIASDNGKSHSHNDTGSIWISLDGEPVLIDLGQEQYRKQSFDSHRYEIPSTESAYHNLPTFGAVQQGIGSAFRATELKYSATDTVSGLSMQLAPAYPKKANLRSLNRQVQLNRTQRKIIVTDSYELSSAGPVAWSFITCRPAKKNGGVVHLEPRSQDRSAPVTMSFDAGMFDIQIETMPLNDPGLVSSWGKAVYRLLISTRSSSQSGTAHFEFA